MTLNRQTWRIPVFDNNIKSTFLKTQKAMQRRKQQERKKVCPHGNASKENCYFCQMEADNGYSDNGQIERIRSSSKLSNHRKMRIVSPYYIAHIRNNSINVFPGNVGQTGYSIPLSHHSNASQSRNQSRRESSLGQVSTLLQYAAYGSFGFH